VTTADAAVERTVLFADIAGSTRLYDQYGDAATKQILSDCLDLMERIVRERKGRVARRIGDEILCTFPDANDAAFAAMQMQSRVSEGDRAALRVHRGGAANWPAVDGAGFWRGDRAAGRASVRAGDRLA